VKYGDSYEPCYIYQRSFPEFKRTTNLSIPEQLSLINSALICKNLLVYARITAVLSILQ